MATNNTSSSNPRAEKMGDLLDALSSGIAKTAAREPKPEPQLLVPEVPDCSRRLNIDPPGQFSVGVNRFATDVAWTTREACHAWYVNIHLDASVSAQKPYSIWG